MMSRMTKQITPVLGTLALVALSVVGLTGPAAAQDARAVVAAAQQALGDVRSVTYSGTARDVAFQQCGANVVDMQCRGTHDPTRPIASYVRVIDLTAPTTRHTGNTYNIGAGGSTTVTPGTFFQQVTPQQADVSQPWAASLDFYLTPWGFLKGAAEQGATVSRRRADGRTYTVLSWSPAVKAPSGREYTINGYLNAQNLVERVETWLGENIMGDMHILALYSDWRDFGGVMAPSRIVQTRGGWPFFQVNVTAARANPPDVAALAPPPAPAGGRGGAPGGAPQAAAGGRGGPPQGAAAGGRGGAPPPQAAAGPAPAQSLTVTSEKLGDGLYRLTTGPGSYDSLVVEFRDHIMMLEAGQSEARALAYIAEARRLVPNKPIRYVMNTHAHADHTAGLPALVAEGATIITHRNNRDFLEKALNTPRTLLDDTLARNPRRARIETVSAKKVYSDGRRTVEMYHTWPVPHSNGLLVAYFPQEKILFQGDFSLPAPGQPANDHVNALAPILDSLMLDFDRYINVHTSAEPQTAAEFRAAVEARRKADAAAAR
jgi:glyoxylase-like metal-dependent hydrolase (beta-lactamase superfamily II)